MHSSDTSKVAEDTGNHKKICWQQAKKTATLYVVHRLSMDTNSIVILADAQGLLSVLQLFDIS